MVLTLGCGCFGYASISTLGEAWALSAVVGTDVIGRVKSGSLSIQKAKIKSAAKVTGVSKSTRDQILWKMSMLLRTVIADMHHNTLR